MSDGRVGPRPGALADSDVVGRERDFLSPVDGEPFFGREIRDERLQERPELLRRDPRGEIGEALSLRPLRLEESEQSGDDPGDVPGRNLLERLADPRLSVADAAAQVELVGGNLFPRDRLHDTMEADVGDVVLAAR